MTEHILLLFVFVANAFAREPSQDSSTFTSTLKLQEKELVVSTVITHLDQPAFFSSSCGEDTGTLIAFTTDANSEAVSVSHCGFNGTSDGSNSRPYCAQTGWTQVASEKSNVCVLYCFTIFHSTLPFTLSRLFTQGVLIISRVVLVLL